MRKPPPSYEHSLLISNCIIFGTFVQHTLKFGVSLLALLRKTYIFNVSCSFECMEKKYPLTRGSNCKVCIGLQPGMQTVACCPSNIQLYC